MRKWKPIPGDKLPCLITYGEVNPYDAFCWRNIETVEHYLQLERDGIGICFDCRSEAEEIFEEVIEDCGENEFFKANGITFQEAKIRAKRNGRMIREEEE